MSLDPDRLVRAYLGYRNPAGDLAWYPGEVEIDTQMGILPGDREEDPYPASETPHGDQHGSSKMPGPEEQPASEARWPVPSGESREKQRSLPLPNSHPEQRDVNIDRFVFNVPDARPDSRYRDKTDVPIRTPGTPGEESGNPTKFDYGSPTRRTIDREAAGMFPKERQREQRGKAKRVSLKWYKRNRSKHRRRMQRRQRRLRTRAQVKRMRKLRNKYPRRFQRRPGGGIRSPAQRSQKWREKKKKQQEVRRADYAFFPVEREDGFPFLYGKDLQYAEIDGFADGEVHFTVFPEFSGEDYGVMGAPERKSMNPIDFLGQAVFDEEDDLEAVMDAIEDEFGEEVWDRGPDEVESPWLDEDAVVASSLWHTHHLNQEPADRRPKTDDQWKDEQQEADRALQRELERDRTSGVPRGTRTTPSYPNAPDHWPSDQTRAPYWKGRPDDQTPATPMNDLTPVEDSGGASKVIPWDSPAVNKQDQTFNRGEGGSSTVPPVSASVKTADTIAQILTRTAPKVKQRAAERPARITGHDRTKGLWFFQSGKHIQRMRVVPKAGSKASNVTQMDVLVSCSCPFWRWQGPEHWSKKHRYLYDRNRTKGTATYPEIRDPKFRHGVCKHIVAVFNLVRSQKLKFSPKQACGECDINEVGMEVMNVPLESLRYLLDRSDGIEVESYLTAEDLVARYLGHT